MEEKKPFIYIMSDSIGETAELVMKAGLSQFGNKKYYLMKVPYVKNETMIHETLKEINGKDALIGFTFVDPKLREYLMKKAQEYSIQTIDIMGPVLTPLELLFKQKPALQPGLTHQLDEDYFKRVEAIEFAVQYDDGRDTRGIHRADFILIGVSRTSKTPLSQYLALKKLKVANVPIVPEVEPPEELFTVDARKCIGLSISPEKLIDIRRERLKSLGLEDQATYADIQRIEKELLYFNKVVKRIGCHVIDVSTKAVEETANIILQMYNKH